MPPKPPSPNDSTISPAKAGVKTPLRIGFILREHFSMVAFTAAVDTLVTTNLVTPEPAFEHVTIGTTGRTVLSDLGIEVSTGTDLQTIMASPLPVDMLIVCGGYRSQLAPEPHLLNALRTAEHRGIRLGGLWNGGVTLIQAGLNQGHPPIPQATETNPPVFGRSQGIKQVRLGGELATIAATDDQHVDR